MTIDADAAGGAGRIETAPGMKDRTDRHDWSSTSLGPRKGWPQSLRTTVDNMLASGHPMCLIWGSDRILLYNDAYADVLGARHPSALGQPTALVWPELWAEISPLIDRTFAGEACVFRDQPLTMTRNHYEEATWWNFAYSPVRDEAGTVVGLLNVTSETTQRVLAIRERDGALEDLRASRERLSALISASSDSLYTMSPDWQEMRQLDGRGFMPDTSTPSIMWMDTYIFPEDRAMIREVIDKAIAEGKPFELEHRVRKVDGSAGWTHSRAVPVYGGRDHVIEWFGMAADATARHETEAALRESEAFTRSVLASSTDCIKVVDLEGNLTFMTEAGMEVMEISDFNDVKGCPWPDFLGNDGPELARSALEEARQGRSSHFLSAADTFARTPKFWSVSVSPIPDGNGRIHRILAVSRDITELEQAREQQRLLNAELAHRIKNTMSVVQAIANQTLGKETSPEAMKAFGDRLAALAASHTLLMGQNWSSARLEEVASAAFTTFGLERFTLAGPPIHIGARATLSLSLMLHELATNAVKYGSLSVLEGKVSVAWETRDDQLVLSWHERGGPPAIEPSRKGFGSRIIRMGLIGSGGVNLQYGVDGLTVEASAPLYQVREA